MRLRLSIHRHGLPVTNTLWFVPDEDAHKVATVATLLEEVNEIIPLEAADWGLEDYVVQVAGFDCLHFLPVTQVLKDEDQVTIRPLTTTEIRARTLAGRHQINEGGQHLVDGVPFGRPLLRTPNRPGVAIPSRKRKRVIAQENEDVDDDDVLALPEGEEDDDTHVGGSEESDTGADRSKKQKLVHFDGEDDLLPSDEEDEDEYQPDEEEESSEGSERDSDSDSNYSSDGADEKVEEHHLSGANDTDSDSDTSSDDTSGTSSTSAVDTPETNKSLKEPQSGSSEEGSDDENESHLDTTSSSSNSSSVSSSASGSEPEELSSKPTVTTHKAKPKPTSVAPKPPGEGKMTTRMRNARKRVAKKLNRLKAAGILPHDANKADLQLYLASIGEQPDQDVLAMDAEGREQGETPPQTTATETANQKGRVDTTQTQTTGDDRTSTSANPATRQLSPRSEEKRQRLLAALASGGGVDVTDEVNARSASRSTLTPPIAPTTEAADAAAAVEEQLRKRPKFDTVPGQRFILNALGLGSRPPRNDAERETLRAKQAAKFGKGKKDEAVEAPQEQPKERPTRPDDYWKQRIDLVAVECAEEEWMGLVEPPPPFPFRQRWYEQPKKKKKGKKGRRDGGEEGQCDTQWMPEFWAEEGRDGLIYEDVEEDVQEGEPDEDQAMAMDGDDDKASLQLQQEAGVQGAAGVADGRKEVLEDDLPPLPEDMSVLPVLAPADVRPGTVIAFKRLEIRNCMPQVSPWRMGRVLETVADGVMRVRLAKRDWESLAPRKQRRVDSRGRRIFERWEADLVGEDDDEEGEEGEEEGVVEVEWAGLVEGRKVCDGQPGEQEQEQEQGQGQEEGADADGGSQDIAMAQQG